MQGSTRPFHVCTRVAIIKAGRIVASGTRDQLEHDAGRHGEILVETRDADDALAAWLAERDIAHDRHTDGGCVVQLAQDAADRVILLRELVEAQLPIRRFQPRTRSLQQIFLDLTRS